MMAKWENMFSSAEIFYFVIVIISVVNFGGVADDDVDGQRGINDLQPFRLNKLNVMWAKATKVNMTSGILPYGCSPCISANILRTVNADHMRTYINAEQ